MKPQVPKDAQVHRPPQHIRHMRMCKTRGRYMWYSRTMPILSLNSANESNDSAHEPIKR